MSQILVQDEIFSKVSLLEYMLKFSKYFFLNLCFPTYNYIFIETNLLKLKYMLVKIILQVFICIIYAELFKTVFPEVFESEYV